VWLLVHLAQLYCGEGDVAYMMFSQERDLGGVDICATQLRAHGLLQRLAAWR
jgi:hypothetical protein